MMAWMDEPALRRHSGDRADALFLAISPVALAQGRDVGACATRRVDRDRLRRRCAPDQGPPGRRCLSRRISFVLLPPRGAMPAISKSWPSPSSMQSRSTARPRNEALNPTASANRPREIPPGEVNYPIGNVRDGGSVGWSLPRCGSGLNHELR